MVNEPPKYRSSTSVGKRQTIPIDINDPRLKPGKIGMVKARSGAEIEIVNLSNLGANSANFKVINGNISGSNTNADLIVPPINNLPPSVYPGGSGPQIIVVSDPSNVSATWGSYSSSTFTAGAGDYLQITFNWDSSISTNATASQFIVSLTDSLGNVKTYGGFPITTGTTSQTILVTPAINESMFNIFTPLLTAVAVEVADPLNNTSNFITGTFSNGYILNLSIPVITVSNVNNGYSVSYTTPSSSSFSGIDIWEIESSAFTQPAIIYGTDGITPTNYNRVYFNDLNPAVIITPNTNPRWVIARFASNGQIYTAFCSGVQATPVPPVTINNTPPTEVTSVTATWDSTSVNDIDINYTMPATNAGVRFIIKLTAPNGLSGYFYIYPTQSGLNQSFQITDTDLYAQFGAYYSSYTGLIQSASTQDVRSSGVTFTVAERQNPLASTKPNPTVTAIVDGYIVSVSNENAQVQHVEVYEYFIDPINMLNAMQTLMDFMDATYVSGGNSGSTSIVMNNFLDQEGMGQNPDMCYGMVITGNGITGLTYVTSITDGPGAGNYTVNLSQNLTSQASGSYVMQGLVASGQSPLTRYTTNYVEVYIVVVYYDEFNNNSLFSDVKTITPINASTALISSAVQVSSTGSIYLGSSNTSVPNVILGTSQTANEAGMFIWGPNDGGVSSAINANVTAVSGTGTVTFTTSSPHGFRTGQYVIFSGFSGGTSTYNTAIPKILTVITPTTFSVSSSGAGTPSAYGIATVSPSTYNGTPSTQIIGDASSPLTFVTKNAQIADWNITSSHIQNDLSIGSFSSGYVGLSGSNSNYSFWAGSSSSDNSDGTAKFSVTPAGAVKASNIVISGGSLNIDNNFEVDTSGNLTANGNITIGGSGSIGGKLQVTGTIYSGTLNSGGTGIQSGTAGYLLNTSGITFSNPSYSNVTSISASTGTLFTQSASIGGWNVNSSQINKTGISGKGNIVLDSSNGYIYVSDANTPNYTAGINSASTSSAIAFWAGQGLTGSQPNPASASNAFRVTMGGALYASGATIDGVVTSTSNGVYGGTVKLDPINDLISLTPSGSTYGAYIIPRNNNLYITAPSSTSPFSSGTLISSSGPTNGPYFSTGLSFSDYWGNTAVGAGMFTGPWNYFAAASGTAASAASKPFITTTSTGIQLSANADIGILIDAGTSATGTKLSSGSLSLSGIPSILLYTSKQTTAPWSPSTAYGAWMQMSPGALNLSATSSVFMGIYGSSATGLPTNANTNSIYMQAGTTRVGGTSGGDGAYSANSKITLDSTLGTGIWALPIQGDISLTVATTPISPDYSPHYMNSYPLGPYPRQRMVVEDPVTGQSKLGMAVYYATGITQPSSGGYIGDLWVIY